jgi:ABC-2 type transport system ATP-binding protein
LIRLETVTKRFGPNVAVDDLSLEVARGEVFGLLGPNGAGKTTTVKMLVGLLRQDSGLITVGGLDVQSNAVACKRMIGYKPEAPYLYDKLTAREHILFAARLKNTEKPEQHCEHLLTMFNLADRSDDPVETLSFGMKSKVALCMAFIGTPKLIILDEPTNGLDPISVIRLRELAIESSGGGASVLISSHMLDFVERICSRSAVIHEGRLCGTVTRDSLTESGKSMEDVLLSCLK